MHQYSLYVKHVISCDRYYKFGDYFARFFAYACQFLRRDTSPPKFSGFYLVNVKSYMHVKYFRSTVLQHQLAENKISYSHCICSTASCDDRCARM